MLQILIAFVTAFLVMVLFLPSTIKMLREKQMLGTDVHKPDKPEVPKGAGFVILFAIVAGLLLVIGVTTFQNWAIIVNPAILAALVAILMAGIIGLLDDILDFRNRTKIALPLVASIPLVALQVGTTTMNVPLIGPIDLGILYPLVIVPLMLTFIVDSTNMYGGMNGLEAGLAIVNSSALVVYVLLIPSFTGQSITSSQMDAATVAAALLGAMVVFFIYNKYPAKVLPGDVGRLPIGATMAAAIIIGNMDRVALIIYVPFLINFLLYLFYKIYVKRSGIEYAKFASPKEDGTLEVVGPFTMYWVLPHFFRVSEKRNVMLLIIFQAIVAYTAVVLLLIGFPFGSGWI